MANALIAFRAGEDSPMAMAGAMLLAEAMENLDVCARFAVSYAKALNRSSLV